MNIPTTADGEKEVFMCILEAKEVKTKLQSAECRLQ